MGVTTKDQLKEILDRPGMKKANPGAKVDGFENFEHRPVMGAFVGGIMVGHHEIDRQASLTMAKTTDEDKLNKLEKSFYAYLQMLKYPWVGVQCITLKLADDTRYTPDFSTLGPNGEFQFYETKGFFRDDAKVKLKIAARQFRMFQFHLVYKKKVKEGGGWDISIVKP